MEIGLYLKKLRREKNYTLNEVANEINMSVSLLSQIENDKASPSLSSLQVLLRFYDIGLSAFFDQIERHDYLITKMKDAETFINKNKTVKLTFLASKLQNTNKVSYKAELNPKSELNCAQLDESILGERFIFVISGSIKIVLNNKDDFTLSSDDSIILRSFVACTITNTSARTAKIILSGTPPVF